MKFDYYNLAPGNTRGAAFKDLVVFAVGDFVAMAIASFMSVAVFFLVFLINPIACFISGYKYLDKHGFDGAWDGCLTGMLLAPIRFILAPIIGIIYYPYLVICAIKKIIKG